MDVSASGQAVIDEKALASIRALQRPGRPDLLARIVDLFVAETPRAITSMFEALEEGDTATVRDVAHSLKSSSAYVGASALSSRCRDLEQVARDGNLPACVAMAEGLDDDVDDVLAALSSVMARAA